jgi:hypothetical protein
MPKVKTFEAACQKLGIDTIKVPDFSDIPVKHQAALIAHFKLVIIAQVLNDGWEPNWDDYDEYKYYPWFYMNSDHGFGLGGVSCDLSYSCVGSRLCFKTEALAKYAATQFKSLYKDYMLIA